MDLSKLYPSNWTLHCWLAFCFWLLVTVLLNLPFLPSSNDLASGNHRLSHYWESGEAFYLQAGWPHGYLARRYQGSSATVSDQWMLDGLATNVLLAIPTLILLVYTLQFWLPRLSLRAILIGMALIALLVQIGVTMAGNVETRESAIRYQLYLIAIYLAPMMVGIVLIGFSLVFKCVRKVG